MMRPQEHDSLSRPHSRSRGGAVGGVLLLLLVVGAVALAGSHHVVNTRSGIRVYPKDRFGFHSTYVDMTTTSFLGLRRHPELVVTMTAHGDLSLLPGGQVLLDVMNGAGIAVERVNEVVNRFDSEGEIRRNLSEAGAKAGSKAIEATERATEAYRELDAHYDVTNRARDAAERGARGLNRLLGGGS